jgi:hypothetical protein
MPPSSTGSGQVHRALILVQILLDISVRSSYIAAICIGEVVGPQSWNTGEMQSRGA